MLTRYDQYTAAIFDQAGIPVLLVGDSAANNVFGYETTLPVTVDELLPLVRAVVRATKRALVVGDLPFGSYEEGPTQALRTAVRFMKEGGCHAVKLEGGRRVARADRGDHRRRHPGDGAHRLHPAARARASAATGCRAAATRPTRCSPTPSRWPRPARSPWCWRWCPARSPSGSPHELRDPDHRHRRRPGHRRPGAGLAGHGRPAHRAGAALRQAVRRPGRRAHRGRPRRFADEVRGGTFPREHTYR